MSTLASKQDRSNAFVLLLVNIMGAIDPNLAVTAPGFTGVHQV